MTEPDYTANCWKPIPEWESYYEANAIGQIRRVSKSMPLKPCYIRREPTVQLNQPTRHTRIRIAPIIATLFLGKCPSNHMVGYKDGNPSNVIAANLKYVRADVVPHDNCLLCNVDGGTDAVTLAYLAGIFDGEGGLCIVQTKQGRHTLLLHITNTDVRLIDWLNKYCGGYTNFVARPGGGRRPVFKWQLQANRAASMLEHIQAFSVIKQEQINVGLEFQRSVRLRANSKIQEDYVQAFAYREGLRAKLRSFSLGRFSSDPEHPSKSTGKKSYNIEMLRLANEGFNLPKTPSGKPRRLTAEQVMEMRKAFAAGEPVKDVATKFHVSPVMAHHIKNRRAWKHVD